MEAFLALIDRMIQLLQVRSLHRKQLFEEVVQPLYHDLEPIAKDYFELFDFVIDGLRTRSHTRQQLYEVTKERATKFIILRRKVQEAVQVFKKRIRDPKVVEFACAVESLFFPSGWVVNTSPYHYISRLFKDEGFNFYEVHAGSFFEIELGRFIDARDELEEKWKSISSLYFDLLATHAVGESINLTGQSDSKSRIGKLRTWIRGPREQTRGE